MNRKLSQHCTYKEATYSKVAVAHNIANEPTKEQLLNILDLLSNVFEPLRNAVGTALCITSLYRSKELNDLVGGASSSQHLCNNGAAMDIDADVYGGVTNNDLFKYIYENLNYDQLILEDVSEDGIGGWVHVSYNAKKNRRETLIMRRINGRCNYIPYVKKEHTTRTPEENEGGDNSNVN
jgi:hypothetical protein